MLEAGYPHLSRAVSTSVPDGFLPSSGGFHLGECQVAAGLLNGQPIGGAQVDAGLATAGRMGDDGGILWYPGRMGLLVFKGFVHHCLGFSSPRTVMISKLLGVQTSSDRMRRMNIVVPSQIEGVTVDSSCLRQSRSRRASSDGKAWHWVLYCCQP